MMPSDTNDRRDEQALSWLLAGGTALASVLIALGLLMRLMRPADAALPKHGLLTSGVGILVLLPVTRVALMLFLFVRKRDYLLAGTAAAVLLIIGIGCVVGGLAQPPHS